MSARFQLSIGPASRRLAPFAVALLLVGCGPKVDRPEPARPVVAQRVALTRTQTPERSTGAVYARYEAPLGFRIACKLVERRVTLGEKVEAGQLLARLDPKDARLTAEAADAALKGAQAQRDLTRRNLKRYAALHGKGVVSQSELDARSDAYRLAEARLREAQKRYHIARNRQTYTALYADHAGVITAVDAEVGQVVAAGQAVFRLAHTGERELRVDIPEGRVEAVRHAGTVTVSFWALPDRHYIGRVREIAAEADPATCTYLVKIALPKTGPANRPGLTGTATGT